MISNDPHLGNSVPSVWYQNEINVNGKFGVGATVPGIPFIAIGRTKDLAWTVTNSKADVSNWFYEKIEGSKYFHDN